MHIVPQKIAVAITGFALLVSLAANGEQQPDHARSDQSARQMAMAATAFLSALNEEQQALATHTFDDDEARAHWSNLPAAFVEREGVRLGDLDDTQRKLLHDLMRASTSSQGYQKLAGAIRLDEILHEEASAALENGTRKLPERLIESWTAENYWVTVFGEPASGATWGWQLSGHHLAANFTVHDGRLSFTPLFLGAEPNVVQSGLDAGWMVLSHEAERGFELLQSLEPDQQKQAIVSATVPDDIIEGPGRKGSLGEYVGIPASELSAGQASLLWQLVREYVGNADHDAADAQLQRIKADGADQLHFAWMGPGDDVGAKYYYRVHGPSILIEYVVEEGVGGSAANHTHSIVRDPGNDYGADWLEKHYDESHR